MLTDRKKLDAALSRVDRRLRLARPEDGPAIQALLAGLAALEWPDLPPDIGTNIAKALGTSHDSGILVIGDGAIVAAMAFHVLPDLLANGHQVLLDDFIVDPKHRKRKLGTTLLEGALALAAEVKADRVWAVMSADNQRGRVLVEHHGFGEEGDQVWSRRL
jgi:GNAT superfamily N-acetyltransferase